MIENAAASDYKEILRFESEIFRVPFTLIMPKLYKDRERCIASHKILRGENGKLIGAYAAYETSLETDFGSLSAVGIGSVAVAKEQRGKGIMSQMMQFIDEEAKRTKKDISFLSGYRKRYERFGYIPCGEKNIYDITEHYIKHNNETRYKFYPLRKKRNELENIMSLYNAQGMRWRRDIFDFELIAATWFDKCFVIYDDKMKFVGYLIANHNLKEVTEILLCDASLLSGVLTAYASAFSKKSISFVLQAWQNDYIKEAADFGEHFRVQASALIKFFSFKKPIELLMNEKLRAFKLCDGTLTMSLGEEKLKVTVKDGVCTVEEHSGKVDIDLSYGNAVTALTTHFSGTDNLIFKAWSPMCPISIPNVDMV